MLIVALPPYWCAVNPTKLVFQTMLAWLKAERTRYNSSSNDEFYDIIINELYKFTIDDVISFFKNADISISTNYLMYIYNSIVMYFNNVFK